MKETSRLNASVRFNDTKSEGRPSIYLFIFVNPLSGDCKGEDLLKLPIQHFRLRRFPQVQVEIHNILDEKDRDKGLENIQLVEEMAKFGKLPSLDEVETNSTDGEADESYKIGATVRTRHIHVWSCGGDGTVMSLFELLVEHNIDLDYMFFSCIPFGTGNDFSQVLGWGRTIPQKNILGNRLQHLEDLITERLQKSEAARLDVWEIEMSAREGGYVRLAGPQRKDGHDVLEIDYEQRGDYPVIQRKMCNYMSIGVQGYVGSGFEKHRAGNRFANMMVYTSESAKWVFWRKFPAVTNFIEKVMYNDKVVLYCPEPNESDDENRENTNNINIPKMTKHPIDFVIQNIPHIWGREIDLWGDATSGLEVVKDRADSTDPDNWTPQLANDGKMEIMTIQDKTSYIKKLANIRHHVSRLGQFETPFEIVFREPKKDQKKSWWKTMFENKYKRRNIICIMCDGEFYIIKDPKSLKFNRFAQVWTLGRHDEKVKGRLVQDEQVSQQL